MWFKKFVTWLSGLFTGNKNGIKSLTGNLLSGNTANSLVNKVTGAGLTGAEQEANQFTAEQAQINRDWQEQMDSTKYQRTVADMMAAGINPALAMSNGVGSAPSGSSGSSVAPGAGISLSDLFQFALLNPQRELIKAQASQARDLGAAAVKNAESNERNATVNERNASVNELLADNTIRLGDSTIQLNNTTMDKLVQDIKESESRVSLQGLEYLAKELNYKFDSEMYDTNRSLLIQQLVYRTVEMSEMRSVIALNNALQKNASTQGEILSADAVGAKLSAEWKENNPKLVKFLEAAGLGTSVIGNVFRGGINFSRSRSASDVRVQSNSTSHNYVHK